MSVRGPAFSRVSPPPFSRLRLGAYGVAAALHIAAISALALLPPETLDRFVDTGRGVEVRFFTVSAVNAESDLPLNAPLLADRVQGAQTQGGNGDDAGGDTGGQRIDADNEANAEPQDEPEPVDAPEPEDDQAEEPAAEPAPDEVAADEAETLPVSPDGTLPAQESPAREGETTPGRRTPARAAGVIAPDRPVDTIQPEEESEAFVVRRPPTFAEIAARAQTGFEPENFRIDRLEGPVGAVIAEVLCLSSGEANREIGDCGDGPNAAQAELALYHIRAFGQGPLEFDEDMDRLEFELEQLGVSPSTLEALRVHFLNAQREQTRRSPLLRAMDRDRASRTDHLGIGPSITPQRARDPSGER